MCFLFSVCFTRIAKKFLRTRQCKWQKRRRKRGGLCVNVAQTFCSTEWYVQKTDSFQNACKFWKLDYCACKVFLRSKFEFFLRSKFEFLKIDFRKALRKKNISNKNIYFFVVWTFIPNMQTRYCQVRSFRGLHTQNTCNISSTVPVLK